METKLLFSLLEAYFSLVTKNNRGLRREHKHLHSVVTRMDMNTLMSTFQIKTKKIDFLMFCRMCE